MKTPIQIYGDKYFNYALFFRDIALEIDQNPEAITKYTLHPAIQELIQDQNSSCLDRVLRLEALCYGDAGVMLACPGPSLSGLLIRDIGSESQKELFFKHVQTMHARTLFAITEPDFGSDANQIESRLNVSERGAYYLSGRKCLFGNGLPASIGVVLAKVTNGPLGMRAVLLTPENLSDNSKIVRKKLKTIALKGAQLSYMEFRQLEISEHQILGQHLSPMTSGMMAVIKTFNRMRPGVAAISLGHAQGQFDYMNSYINRPKRTLKLTLETINSKLQTLRFLLHKTALKVEENPLEQSHSSVVKVLATQLAEKISQVSLDYFGRSLFLEHPLLAKWTRDVYAYEFMEGTTNIHLLNIFNDYKQRLILK